MSVPGAGRLRSLDVFRGAAIGGMILVNSPGDWGNTYAPLLHAEWHGWTPTDLVFPFFLFALGVAVPLAFGRRLEEAGGERGPLYRQIARRTLILLALGLLLNSFPYVGRDWATVRLPVRPERVTVYPLDGNGRRRASMSCVRSNGRARFELAPGHRALWYEVVIE